MQTATFYSQMQIGLYWAIVVLLVILALIVLRVAGALVQHFGLKTGITARMSSKLLPGKEPTKDALS